MRFSREPRYVVNTEPSGGSIFLLTAGSQGLWVVSISFSSPNSDDPAAQAGFDIARVSGWSGDVTPVGILALREGDPAALSTCLDGSALDTIDWGDRLGFWRIASDTFPAQIGWESPVYVAPGSSLAITCGASTNIYLSEG